MPSELLLTSKERERLAKVRKDLEEGLNPYAGMKGMGDRTKDAPNVHLKVKTPKERLKTWLAKDQPVLKLHPNRVRTYTGPPVKARKQKVPAKDVTRCLVCHRPVQLVLSVFGKLLESVARHKEIEVINYVTPQKAVLPVHYRFNRQFPQMTTGRVCHRKKCQRKVDILDDPAFKQPTRLHEPALSEARSCGFQYNPRAQRTYGV